jgi:hypothetical protein
MGGQACVLYGAAEFSRDTDIAVLASPHNLDLLRAALHELRARRIAVPPFDLQYLLHGHAVHFRCYHPEALQMRIDVMSVMRGVDDFEILWERRAQLAGGVGIQFDVLSLADLVRAKKTQRDKDWPMVRRLLEADYTTTEDASTEQLKFWLLESRTPEMLRELARAYPSMSNGLVGIRPLLRFAPNDNPVDMERALHEEEQAERTADRKYWEPLKAELEALRQTVLQAEEDM